MDPLCIGITLIFTTLTVLDLVFLTFQNIRPFHALGLLKEVKPNIPNGRWGYWEMWSYKGMTQNQSNGKCGLIKGLLQIKGLDNIILWVTTSGF